MPCLQFLPSVPTAILRFSFPFFFLYHCSNFLTNLLTPTALLFPKYLPHRPWSEETSRTMALVVLPSSSTPALTPPPPSWPFLSSAEIHHGAKGKVWCLELPVVPALPCQAWPSHSLACYLIFFLFITLGNSRTHLFCVYCLSPSHTYTRMEVTWEQELEFGHYWSLRPSP